MPRANTKERTFLCQHCDKAYSYQSGLCAHMREKHPNDKLNREINSDITLVSLLDPEKILKSSRIIREALDEGNIRKNWIAILLSLLSGNIKITSENIHSLHNDEKTVISDSIFNGIVSGFIRGLDKMVFDNIHTREDHILKNVYDINLLIRELDENLPKLVLEFRRRAEKAL